MPVIGGFFGFLIFMAVAESYGWIPYIYSAFWLTVIGGICFALFRVYRKEVLEFIRSRRRQGGVSIPTIQPHVVALIRDIKTQLPNFRFQRELGVLLTVIGVLIFLGHLFSIQHVGNGWAFTQWLVWLFILPCILLAIGFVLTAWAESVEKALAENLDTERVGEASKLYREKELRIVEQARADINALMPPPGPFEVFTADVFPRNRIARILNPLIDLKIEWLSNALPNCDPPLNSLDEKTDQADMTVREFAKDLIAIPAISVELLHWRKMGFSDEDRFRHQFIVGNTGSGKTTYLSAQINEDLQRLARGECSLFIMDSKNELIPNIAKLNYFSEGAPLAGKLTYIELNPEYPIALNIFESSISPSLKESRQAQQSALQLIEFFLSSILQMDATGHQETLLRYAIPAVLAVPGATLQTLKELLDEGGFEKFEPDFRHLRQAEWLKANLHSKSSFNITRHALRGRIESMLADDTFHDLFCKPRSTLHLSAELNEPRVVLVNTLKGELPVTAGPFGCFFIAKLLQLTEQRTLQRGPKLPVFVYIDEASDYLANNAAVIELVNKARAQNISFTFAIQGVEDVSPEVLAALRRCNIQAFNGTGQGGTFDVAITNRPPVTVRVPKFNFAANPRISEAAFDELRLDMWRAHDSKASLALNSSEPPANYFSAPRDESTEPAKY